jgi:acyl-lipid omega-6 desaturase (Delta-12 desaturase)
MFSIGPAYLFILRHRLPRGMMRGGWAPWLSTMGTNAAIAILIAALIWLVGTGPILLAHVPNMGLAAARTFTRTGSGNRAASYGYAPREHRAPI